MQPIVAPPRDDLDSDQVVALIVDEEAVTLTGGMEIVDIDLNVVEDISDDLAGGKVERNSYADLHATATFRITRSIDWGGDLLRPYIVISSPLVSARFNLGVYHPSTPGWPLEESPPTFEVTGYDVLLRLNQAVGDAFSINTGESYLAKIEDILKQRGYTRYVIDQSQAATTAPGPRVWAFDDSITWLKIVNDMLGAIGYAGIWSDWDGQLRCEPYIRPIDRSPEWTYSDDPLTTLLSVKRVVEHDYFDAPNRWVIYRSNLADGDTPTEGGGIYTYVNTSRGETSVNARRGLVITKTEGVDVAGPNFGGIQDFFLRVRAQMIIDADMAIPVLYNLESFPNPLHWHFDRLRLNDSASLPFAEAMCTSWSLPLPPDSGDMVQQWRILT